MKNLQMLFSFLLLTVFLSGCSSLTENRKNASSGWVGCPPNEVSIYDEKANTWTAKCKDKVFYCSAVGGLNCKEAE